MGPYTLVYFPILLCIGLLRLRDIEFGKFLLSAGHNCLGLDSGLGEAACRLCAAAFTEPLFISENHNVKMMEIGAWRLSTPRA
jgi:hypothetical protein